ncbi:hypothetical protein Trydic_g6438 [Trypoxylus dichotomus]
MVLSPVDQWLQIWQKYLNTLVRCGQVDVIYTDLFKAYDCIDDKLLHKLDDLDFVPSVLKPIQSYLTQRRCYVVCNGYISREFTLTSGVPQGSNLGPLFLTLYTNDLLLLLKWINLVSPTLTT